MFKNKKEARHKIMYTALFYLYKVQKYTKRLYRFGTKYNSLPLMNR